MSATLKAVENSDVAAVMADLGRKARAAARVLALAPAAQKNAALGAMAGAVRKANSAILAANAEDLAQARASGASAAYLDLLTLDEMLFAAI